MPSPLPPDRLGPRLAEVYQSLGPLYRKVLRRVEQDEQRMGMSVGVRAVLDDLTRAEPATVPTLTDRLELSRQFVQRMVNDALAAGWVERHDNPAHKRSSLLRLTDDGRAAIRRVLEREHELMAGGVGDERGLTDADIDTTLRVLAEMDRSLDAVATEMNIRPTT